MDDFAQSREPDDLFSDDIELVESQTISQQPSVTSQPRAPTNAPTGPAALGTGNARGGKRGANSGQRQRPVQVPDTTPAPETQPEPKTDPSTSQQSSALAPADDRVHAVRGDRSATGPPKPTKRNEAELTDLMERMRIKNAAKASAHARMEKDQANYDRREAEAAQKAQEERKSIHEQNLERAKNAARKVKAQGVREWDSDKVESDIVDSRRARGGGYTRGANGGVSSGGRTAGLSSSKFAGGDEDDQRDSFRGRGESTRGRGRGGRGRGGNISSPTDRKAPTESDFPALAPNTTPSAPKENGGLAASAWAAGKPPAKETSPFILEPPTPANASWADQMDA